MKKILNFIFAISLVTGLFVGCNNGKLKAGVYEAENVLSDSTATVKVTVDADGKITDVYFDETYDDSTKKSLGDDYGMKSDWGSQIGEWYEHVAALEKAIVENQGVAFITLDDKGKTDVVSGCTIQIDHLVKTFNDAIAKAK